MPIGKGTETLSRSRPGVQNVAQAMSETILDCSPETSIAEAARRMHAAGHSSILVRDGERVVGIWTDRDALAQAVAGTDPERTPVSHVMSTPVPRLPSSMGLAEATTHFKRQGLEHCVVVDEDEQPCGVVARRDIVARQGVEWFMRLHTVRDALDGAPAVLGPGVRAGEAMRTLHANGWDAAVVRAPDGSTAVLSSRNLIGYLGAQVENMPAYQLARTHLPTIGLDESLFRARNMLIDNGVRHLGAVDAADSLVGLVGTREILSAIDRGYVDQLEMALEQREDALRTSAERYRALVDRSPDAIALHRDQRILFINPAGARLLGAQAPGRIMGRSLADFLVETHDLSEEERAAFLQRETGSTPREERVMRLDQREIFVEMSMMEISYADQHAWQVVMRDITRRKHLEDELRMAATTDQLTGIYNRQSFDEHLHQAMREVDRYDGNLCLIMFDLDHFKAVNDDLGHDVGDEVLQRVVERIAEKLRDTDVFARWGGEEFMVLAPGIDRRGGERLADKLRAAMHVVEVPDGRRLTASFAVATYRRNEQWRRLLKRLDNALYDAKRSGRDRISYAD